MAIKGGKNAAQTEMERVEREGSVLMGEVRDDSGLILVWARRPFGYLNQELDRGQVFPIGRGRNDEKLVRLGYVLSLLKGDTYHNCRECGKKFIDLDTLNAHGHKRHGKERDGVVLPSSPGGATVDETAAQVQAMEREEKYLDEVAPLNFDKTAASRRG